VLSVIKLSQLFPGTGGMYLYAKQGLGDFAGYISAWLYMTGYTFTIVVEFFALRQTLANSHDLWLFHNPLVFNVLVVVLCMLISLASMQLISRFLSSLTIIKLLPLITLIILIPFVFNTSFTVTGQELSMLPLALPLLIFGYCGFESCTNMSHLIKDSQKNAPRAIFLGFFATACIYTLFHFGVLNLMGAAQLGQLGAAKFPEFISLPIPYLREILIFLIPTAAAISFLAVALGVISSNAALLHILAEERIVRGSSLLSRTTSLGRPFVILGLQGVIVFLLLTYLPSLDIAGVLCIFGIFSSFFLPVLSLVLVGKRRKDIKIMLVGVLGLIAVSAFMGYSWYTLAPDMMDRMKYSAILLVALVIGVLIRKRK
jgi:amino acid transporter